MWPRQHRFDSWCGHFFLDDHFAWHGCQACFVAANFAIEGRRARRALTLPISRFRAPRCTEQSDALANSVGNITRFFPSREMSCFLQCAVVGASRRHRRGQCYDDAHRKRRILVCFAVSLRCAAYSAFDTLCHRGYGATAARLTPDQKVGSSNLSGLIYRMLVLSKKKLSRPKKTLSVHAFSSNHLQATVVKRQCARRESNPGHKHGRLV